MVLSKCIAASVAATAEKAERVFMSACCRCSLRSFDWPDHLCDRLCIDPLAPSVLSGVHVVTAASHQEACHGQEASKLSQSLTLLHELVQQPADIRALYRLWWWGAISSPAGLL